MGNLSITGGPVPLSSSGGNGIFHSNSNSSMHGYAKYSSISNVGGVGSSSTHNSNMVAAGKPNVKMPSLVKQK